MSESQKVDRAYGFFHGHWDVDRNLGHKQAGHTCDHCTFAPDGVLLLYHGMIFRTAHEKRLSNHCGVTVLNISQVNDH